MFALVDPLPTCDPNLVPMVSSRVDPFTPRRAVDSSGRLGSFYDACCDQVLPQSSSKFSKRSATSQHSPECYIRPCNPEQSQNLLEWYNIHRELRLSVALQMVREVGVGSMINYSRPVDRYTRFISYNYISHTDYVSDDEFKSLSQNGTSMPDTSATHVIVLVNWGVCAVAIIQLPPDDQIVQGIDHALKNLCDSLKNNRLVLSSDDEHLLTKMHHTEVFSSIPALARINSITEFHREISQIKANANPFKPYNYNLCSIHTFYSPRNSIGGMFMQLQPEHADRIEDYLLRLSSYSKRLRRAMDQHRPNVEQYIKEQLCEVHTKWSTLQNMYMHEIQRLQNIVISIRRGKIEYKRIEEALDYDKRSDLIQSIDDFEYDLCVMQEKENLIHGLLEKHSKYRNANEYDVQNGDNEETMQQKLFRDANYDCFICFSDILRKEKKSKWDDLITQSIKEHSKDPYLRLIFIDFSYCSYELSSFLVLHKPEKNSDTIALKPSVTPSAERSRNDGTINILLLGESGVGKSTFINAFANYLTFDTLEQAQKKPIVLKPVSFLMTVGDDFQEKQVNFGEHDNLSDEDYTHAGYSVTQHCKSYVFTLKDGENKGRKLRIIDTPGIGNVRGVVQDDINMQHILLYMSNLSHLNGVCILMKPNNARLSIFFRSCFVQLFDLLGEDARDRIIFCFTNARATFYTPGDTGPLLKQLLKSLPVKDIPFNKTNTFCFDSKSFRYLVAKQNGIEFRKSGEKDYEDSWERSSTESKRFLQYIDIKATVSSFPCEHKSIKDAQLQITTMIRPILEAMRNILRNIALCNAESRATSIDLRPQRIDRPSEICATCPRPTRQYGVFWIMGDSLHVLHNKCRTCDCNQSDHYAIDYQLEYKLCNDPVGSSNQKMTKTLKDLYQTSAEFAHFLMSTTDILQNDLFHAGFERMIKEEGDICKTKTPCPLNESLLNSLKQLIKNYEEAKKKLLVEKERIDLSKIYDKIDEVSRYPLINSQVAAANEWHKLTVRQNECEVSS